MSQPQAANLSTLLAQTAALFPDRPGLIQGDRVWTWNEVNARVDALVQGLRSLGMTAGDKMLVQSRNNAALFESCWAAFRLGAVWVPTNFRLTPPEVAYLGSSSDATVMLAEDCFAGHVDAVKSASLHLRLVVTIGRARKGEIGFD
ncbi:MAG: AMP-binding protein, partial [Burkholderiales bacterium]|nr:AMP-binding protein [Burkholderiales bacterium]